MTIRYDDGSFSEIMNAEDTLERAKRENALGVKIKSIHLGTMDELKAEMNKASIEDRIAALEEKLEDDNVNSDIIQVPSEDEVRKICKDET